MYCHSADVNKIKTTSYEMFCCKYRGAANVRGAKGPVPHSNSSEIF